MTFNIFSLQKPWKNYFPGQVPGYLALDRGINEQRPENQNLLPTLNTNLSGAESQERSEIPTRRPRLDSDVGSQLNDHVQGRLPREETPEEQNDEQRDDEPIARDGQEQDDHNADNDNDQFDVLSAHENSMERESNVSVELPFSDYHFQSFLIFSARCSYRRYVQE